MLGLEKKGNKDETVLQSVSIKDIEHKDNGSLKKKENKGAKCSKYNLKELRYRTLSFILKSC